MLWLGLSSSAQIGSCPPLPKAPFFLNFSPTLTSSTSLLVPSASVSPTSSLSLSGLWVLPCLYYIVLGAWNVLGAWSMLKSLERCQRPSLVAGGHT